MGYLLSMCHSLQFPDLEQHLGFIGIGQHTSIDHFLNVFCNVLRFNVELFCINFFNAIWVIGNIIIGLVSGLEAIQAVHSSSYPK